MPKASDGSGDEHAREKIIGLGERSFRKSYFPELQRRMAELERLRMLLDRSSDMVFVLAASSARLLDFNDTVLAQLGATREELLGRSLYELLDEPSLSAVVEAVSRKPSSPASTAKVTARLRRKSGTEIPVELNLTAAAIGGVDYALVIARDVTEQQRVEEALRRGKHEAEAASRAKEEFINIASHELRTPLTSVMLLVDRKLRHGATVGDERAFFLRMKRLLDRLTRLVEEMLDVSRLGAGPVRVKRVETDLGPLVDEVLAGFREQYPDRRFELTAPSAAVRLPADPVLVAQIVSHLLENAAKYSPAGSPVEVRLEAGADEAVVSVTDHGAGISREHQARLFTRFFRPRTDLTLREPGLGLGLSICRELTSAHGGRIWVESEEGRGSTFSFSLPLRPEG